MTRQAKLSDYRKEGREFGNVVGKAFVTSVEAGVPIEELEQRMSAVVGVIIASANKLRAVGCSDQEVDAYIEAARKSLHDALENAKEKDEQNFAARVVKVVRDAQARGVLP
ncbi:MAG: hypothetical protein AB7O60_03235 [Variibacter sp.]